MSSQKNSYSRGIIPPGAENVTTQEGIGHRVETIPCGCLGQTHGRARAAARDPKTFFSRPGSLIAHQKKVLARPLRVPPRYLSSYLKTTSLCSGVFKEEEGKKGCHTYAIERTE